MRNAGKGSLKRFSGVLCAAGLAAALVGAPATAFADDAASDLTVADSVVSEEVVEASAVIENSAQDSELSQVPTVPALPGGILTMANRTRCLLQQRPLNLLFQA